MSSESDAHIEAESTINDSYGTTIPAEIRNALDDTLEPGDTVRWVIVDGDLSLEIVHERYGAFEDVEPFDGPAWDSETAAESAWSE
ncbi:AbrB/MazE/SpoVT family DNA-binding domain-containing protein [Halorubrum laminariae]|uniref:AbrB/MazE/SpoVT family DNA-binding domain-containing protein n=1 Tax=Halorubrum laminariae TaxID=1433523 RepID=A0ABD6C3Q2_9EURY|nr:AbrB/MazE/SpoVT family DNA-binding domain-containing protein [Halorubrum laminariae]